MSAMAEQLFARFVDEGNAGMDFSGIIQTL
jgi:hypothetical protein